MSRINTLIEQLRKFRRSGLAGQTILIVFSFIFTLTGIILIVLYSFSTQGPHLRYAVVGLLVALAALSAGSFLGFLLGVPKAVSSGEVRMKQSPDQWKYSPSTNLAEVSDWLTKLLLGAGLVGLTSLGRPIGNLINTIGAGLEEFPDSTNVYGPAQVMAGAILCNFLLVGILSGYLVTTLWYFVRISNLMVPECGNDQPTITAAPAESGGNS